jgi:hypothetical protein
MLHLGLKPKSVSKSMYFSGFLSWLFLICLFVVVNIYFLFLDRRINHNSLVIFDLIKVPFYLLPFLTFWLGFKVRENSNFIYAIKRIITTIFLSIVILWNLIFFINVLSDLSNGYYKNIYSGQDPSTHKLIETIDFPNSTVRVFLAMGGGAAGYADTTAIQVQDIGYGFTYKIKFKSYEYCEETRVEKLSNTKVRILGCDEEIIMEDIR